MTLQELLQRKPSGLGPEHERLAKVLLGRPEGISRDEAPRVLDLEERVFRRLIEEIVKSEWIPIAPDPKTGRYRILRADEAHLVNEYATREAAKARSIFRHATGLQSAFVSFHQAGRLFISELEPLEVNDAA